MLPFEWGIRTYLMGVINVTPDSFSGDGLLGSGLDPVDVALDLQFQGADVIDVGGESTRPGASPVSEDEELRRVLPALRAIGRRLSVPISVDTRKPAVARAALVEGASLINDVSMLGDPAMIRLAAESGAGLVLVHRGRSETADAVTAELAEAMGRAVNRGVLEENIILDPGLGIGKDWRANLEILRGLPALRELGRPLLVGPSRKGMIGHVLDLPPHERLEGTAALVTLCIAGGADIVRVHDVRAMARVARMTDALARG